MTEQEFKSILGGGADQVHAFLSTCLEQRDIPVDLSQAMQYSLLAGGKRIRPVLFLTWAEMLQGRQEDVLPFAAAIECIHTYSLVHDDLPAMDNDALRRGIPTNHKKFGEAMAILAGDALLTFAFQLMSETVCNPGNLCRAMQEISMAAGPGGMVGGQVQDVQYTGRGKGGFSGLQQMHLMKTGALLTSSCVCGAILGHGGQEDISNAREFGYHIGLAFQIADDILDVVGDQQEMGKPVGSDEKQGKMTYPSIFGVEKSKDIARKSVSSARAVLETYPGRKSEFLRFLAGYIVDRVS